MNNKNFPAFKNFEEAVNYAGYTIDWSENVFAMIEASDRFIFLFEKLGDYTVGVFMKATISQPGDYREEPEYEGEDLQEALKQLGIAAAQAGK